MPGTASFAARLRSDGQIQILHFWSRDLDFRQFGPDFNDTIP